MRRDRMADLANIIEGDLLPNVRFDMSEGVTQDLDVDPVCGTAACIAGYAVCAAYGNRNAKRDFGAWWVCRVEATRILGLDYHDARALFEPRDSLDRVIRKSRRQAAKVLRHAAKTGTIDWEAANA